MASMTPTQTIEAVFAAFGRGDIPFILGKLSSDCRWTQPASVPWGGTHVGPEGVGKFFSILDAECTTTLWEVDEVVEAGEVVYAVGRHGAKGRKSGNTRVGEWAFRFTVRDGKITSYQGYPDTAEIKAMLG